MLAKCETSTYYLLYTFFAIKFTGASRNANFSDYYVDTFRNFSGTFRRKHERSVKKPFEFFFF